MLIIMLVFGFFGMVVLCIADGADKIGASTIHSRFQVMGIISVLVPVVTFIAREIYWFVKEKHSKSDLPTKEK